MARLNWPPIVPAASNRSTLWPRSASVVAAARPAGPAPITATRFLAGASLMTRSSSCPARGLTRQLASLALNAWSRQAWLQAMQVLISLLRPCAALLTNSGSARKGRAMLTMSAQPLLSTCSATSGMFRRLLVMSGIVRPAACRSSRSFLVTQVKAPRGTEVAMVGTRASCQPMPLLISVAPAASTALASNTTSSQLLPSGIRSMMDRR